MPSLGPMEIVVVLFIALLVFGPTKLPEVARQVGRALNEVRHFQEMIKDELDGVMHGALDDGESSGPSADSIEPAGPNGPPRLELVHPSDDATTPADAEASEPASEPTSESPGEPADAPTQQVANLRRASGHPGRAPSRFRAPNASR
jgi:TatA/E family protein of Tat protein translocase